MIEPPSVRTLPDQSVEDVYDEGIRKIEKIRNYCDEQYRMAVKLIPDFNDNFQYCAVPNSNVPLVLNHLIWLLREMKYRVKVSSASPLKQGELF